MTEPAGDTPIMSARGLTEEEAARRLREEGPNELPASRGNGLIATLWDVIREPMLLLLLGGGAIYLALGNAEEALILLTFVFVVIGIGFYQKQKTERALEALRDLSSPRASVIRDGAARRIPGREVVRGDVLTLAEGDRVPADGVVLESSNLAVDESLLTGESVPVRKTPLEPAEGEATSSVFSGTLVVGGRGIVEVRATGAATQMGEIGQALKTLEPEATPLQREVNVLVRNLAIVGVILAAAVVVIYGLFRGTWLEGLLAGITLSMAILPEEFPVVLTVFLALGAWRISQNGVLTRRMPVVETLGSATVLCVDKTGTLTKNQMTVERLAIGGTTCDVAPGGYGCLSETADASGEGKALTFGLPDAFHELVEFGILASQRDPFDPMEKAFLDLGRRALTGTEHLHADWGLVREYPLSDELLALSHVWASPDKERYVIAAKGAPEAIADLCHLPADRTAEIDREVQAMAADGLRILGVARAYFGGEALPAGQHDFTFEFLGLVGLADPVRPDVAAAVDECETAGVRVIMITGDYPATARAIARQIGLPDEDIVSGREMDQMSDEDLTRRAATASIFARVVPEQKLRIVQALKSAGEIVAMTGDGVNDAPALKAADIGVAMGGRGTDVAREAAALVLVKDDFSSIVAAVRMGRRIFDNLRKAMSYILAVHVPIAGMSLLPVAFGWPLVLSPVHIAFLELIIDPASSVVFEAVPAADDTMRRPPRRLDEPLFARRAAGLSVTQGIVALAVVLAVYLWARAAGRPGTEVRALTFTTLVIANLGLILANLSWSRTLVQALRSPNQALRWVVAGTLVFLGAALYVPALRSTFGFGLLHAEDVAIAVAAGVASVLWFEALKLLGLVRRQGSVD